MWYRKKSVQAASIVAVIVAIFGVIFLPDEVQEETIKNSIEPSNLSISFNKKRGGIDLYWTDNSSNEKGFKVYRRIQDSQPSYHLVQVLPPESTYYHDPLKTCREQSYYYQVCSYNMLGNSERLSTSITKKLSHTATR